MSVAAGKVGAPVASASTARFHASGRSAFAAEEGMPISGLLPSGGAGPEEDALRDDDTGDDAGLPWQRTKHHRPIIVSRFASMLTSYEIDQFLFYFRMFANDHRIIIPVAPVARRYESNYIVLRYGTSLHGRNYNRLH